MHPPPDITLRENYNFSAQLHPISKLHILYATTAQKPTHIFSYCGDQHGMGKEWKSRAARGAATKSCWAETEELLHLSCRAGVPTDVSSWGSSPGGTCGEPHLRQPLCPCSEVEVGLPTALGAEKVKQTSRISTEIPSQPHGPLIIPNKHYRRAIQWAGAPRSPTAAN